MRLTLKSMYILYICVVYQFVMALIHLLNSFLLWIVSHLPFKYWYDSTINMMIYVDVVYGNGTVLYQISGYVIFESDRSCPPHLLLIFLYLSAN